MPKASEAENIFVTFAFSASHVAFGSIRMEPAFMTLSQSAAIAAVIAIDDNVPVQQVNYAKLRTRLLANDVALERSATKATPSTGSKAKGNARRSSVDHAPRASTDDF